MRSPIAGAAAFVVAALTVFAGFQLAPDDEPLRPAGLAAADPPLPIPAKTAQAGLGAPTWAARQAWLIAFSTDFRCWAVVVSQTSLGYEQGLSCDGADRALAQMEAYEFAYLGDFRHDLAGTARDGEVVRWFDWPLTDGRTWSTTYMGVPLTGTAAFAEVDGPFGTEPGYVVELRDADGDVYATYDYVPSIGWWGRFSMGSFSFRVQDFTTAFTGTALTGEADLLFLFRESDTFSLDLRTFPVEEEHELLYYFRYSASLSTHRITVRDPSGRVQHEENYVLGNAAWSQAWIEAIPGTWQVDAPSVSTGFAIQINGMRYERHAF